MYETIGNMNPTGLVRLFTTVTNTWEKQFKSKKNLLWLIVSEVTAHGWLVAFWGGLWWDTVEGQGVPHPMAARKQKHKVGLGARYSLQGQIPSDLLSPAKPHLQKFPSPHYNTVNLWIHQWNNLLIIYEPAWSIHLSMIGSTIWGPCL
jgi:hypothetical protein